MTSISQLYALYLQHPLITTDSRNCPPGSIFLALKGASFNGNRFAAQAIGQGCSYAIVDEAAYAPAGDGRYIVVDNCLQTFKDLAREHRRRFAIPVIGITGTNGKTTTKELVSTVLAQKYNVLHTEGNFNNDVGVPKTLFRLAPEHQIAVIEMGASHPGDIRTLAETAEPTCGLITNVGRAHLQGFGSFEGVIKTKGELYDFLRSRNAGPVFIDADNAHLQGISGGLDLYKYGTQDADKTLKVRGKVLSCTPFVRFCWERTDRPGTQHEVQTSLIGTYNLPNLLAAVSVGLHFGVDEALIDSALAGYVPSNNRSQLTITPSNRLIVDAYNANPTSMAAALDNFASVEAPHKMAILGEMRELGEASEKEHRQIADLLRHSPIEKVWLVGREFEKTGNGFRTFANVEAVKEALLAEKPQGYTILIKGSNGTRLFELPELL